MGSTERGIGRRPPRTHARYARRFVGALCPRAASHARLHQPIQPLESSAMTQDARVASALAHWGPRFVANGVTLTDFEEVVGSLGGWEGWCRAWSDRAAVHEALGREALSAGKLLSAGEHL